MITDFEEPQPAMTLAELKQAIAEAKEVRVYVPVNDFFLEVVVAKTKLLRSLESRLAEWREFDYEEPATWEAEWLEEGILLVGGDPIVEEDDDD